MSLQKWMTLFNNKYRIESARLKGYDYSFPGEYFVTICTGGMIEYFGDVMDGEIKRNDVGEIAHKAWIEIPNHHKHVMLDEFIIMPNHVHGIIVLCENNQ
jgi:REP element-mobilizing transposase RayT